MKIMTEEERKEVDDAIAMFQEHERQMEALLVKYLGENVLAFGRGIEDLWFKKRWYANRIKEFGISEGCNAMRQRRCKSHLSKQYQHYQNVENELRQAADALILEMLLIGHVPEPISKE